MYEFLTLIHKQKTLTQASSHTINVRFCMEIDQSVDRLKYFYICVAMEFHYLTLRESSKNCHVILRSTRMKTSKLISLCAYESFESLIPHIFHSPYMLSVHCLLNFFLWVEVFDSVLWSQTWQNRNETKQFAFSCSSTCRCCVSSLWILFSRFLFRLVWCMFLNWISPHL